MCVGGGETPQLSQEHSTGSRHKPQPLRAPHERPGPVHPAGHLPPRAGCSRSQAGSGHRWMRRGAGVSSRPAGLPQVGSRHPWSRVEGCTTGLAALNRRVNQSGCTPEGPSVASPWRSATPPHSPGTVWGSCVRTEEGRAPALLPALIQRCSAQEPVVALIGGS